MTGSGCDLSMADTSLPQVLVGRRGLGGVDYRSLSIVTRKIHERSTLIASGSVWLSDV